MSLLRTGKYVDGKPEFIDEGPSRGRINRARSSAFTGELVQGESGAAGIQKKGRVRTQRPGFNKPQEQAA